MATRFTDTNEWDEDWFISLGGEYQHLWKYIKDGCDIAGVWKPNVAKFQALTKFNVNLDTFFKKVTADKQRIIKLANDRWFIPGFVKFQYFNRQDSYTLALSNPLHKSIYLSLFNNGVELTTVRGLREVCQSAKDKDKVTTKKKQLLIPFCFESENFKKKYAEWIEFRKEKGKPLTQRSIDRQMIFLSSFSEDEACKIIDNSIMNGWQGLWPEKKQHGTERKQQSVQGSIDAIDAATLHILRDLDEATGG